MKSSLKKVLAKYRLLTKSKRALPDFIIIGTQKGGTTSLYEYLKKHPDLKSNYTVKELNFFNEKYKKGLDWYRSNFPVKKEGILYYEASPYYIFNPLAPKRISETLPEIKLIALLRNPIDRAYSHYQHQVRAGRETLSFEDALKQEQERLEGEEDRMLSNPGYESYNHRKFSYIERGKYIEQIKRWERNFKKEQLLIISSEEFWEYPDETFKRIFDFLGVRNVKISSAKKHNVGNYKDKMSAELREKLNDIYRPYNEELYKYLDKDFKWN